MENTFAMQVDDYVKQNFKPEFFKIESFPALPHAKRVIDHKNDELVVFWNHLYNKVDVMFPDNKK